MIVVETLTFRQALQALIPFVPKKKKASDAVTVIRCELVGSRLQMAATNTSAAALAVVPTDEDDGDEILFALSPDQARTVLSVFTVGGDEGSLARLQIIVDGPVLELLDISGLIPGQSLTLPLFGVSPDFPDVPGVIGQALAATSYSPSEFATAAPDLHCVIPATKAYSSPVLLTPKQQAPDQVAQLVVVCGEYFVAVVPVARHEAGQTAYRDGWAARLPNAARGSRSAGLYPVPTIETDTP